MKIVGEFGRDDLAKVYVAFMRDERHLIEFVESLQPPHPRDKKWVLIVSSLFGCPVKCRMCDASGDYLGKLTCDEILQQIDYLVRQRFPDGRVNVEKFKIQFARMGEPAFNRNTLEVLDLLPERYDAPGLMPSISTVAPKGAGRFFDELIDIKNRHYADGHFQLQFSIHTTDAEKRDELIPLAKWSFDELADYGDRYHETNDRKLTLNFAAAQGYPIDPKLIREHFDPERFLIKLTPLNPTLRIKETKLASLIDPDEPATASELVSAFRAYGFDTILSIGEVEENRIGSNCGLFVSTYRQC